MVGPTITVTVQALDHSSFPLIVSRWMTGNELKAMIAAWSSIPISELRVLHSGKPVDRAYTLLDYGVDDGDTLHIVLRH